MSKRIIFIRCVLWFGVVADFLNVLAYCFPQMSVGIFGGDVGRITPFTRYALAHAAVLMGAWTLLLVWTDRRPIERRGVMLLTVPIALGIFGSFCYLLTEGILSGAATAMLAAPLVTAGLFLAAYLLSRTIDQSA